MYRRHGQKLSLVLLLGDLAVTALAWFAAYFLRFALFASPHGVPDRQLVAEALPLLLAVAAIAYRQCGLYEIHRLRQLPRELSMMPIGICKARCRREPKT